MSVLQSLIDGIAQGAVFALVAVGIALVFGVLRLVNFAYGELITIGGYTLALTSDWPIPLSLLACLAASVALAVLTERVAFRPLRNAAPATTLVATFAVAFSLEAVWRIAFGVDGRSADVLGGLNRTAISGALDVRWITIVELVLGVALLAALGLLLNRTNIGLQMRAAAADIRTARALGVRADRVITFAFVLAGLLAGVVAMLLTAAAPLVEPTFGLQITIFALVGVVVGGMDNLVSATLGGFALGLANSLLGDILPADERVFLPSFTFLLVIIVLVLRPAGLFRSRSAAGVERV
ncbi:branched-chain amino acid ABC transporter permease [Capillimicrobium parvum]|uniref:High-affinity branched-chain amino acid transport system permease protein LivH n=1 Tax=Capillimicrobium parvum TaxID=2884022 RepID=A0A9E6XZC1_9ACTN|nr:branched-chain amino acid ABC transporter permease [Capillimicrobium parvum]UGS37254.1 High-affinity branched-chain amino acid transport system permease protein LivH [Capillimicrobium parvum]